MMGMPTPESMLLILLFLCYHADMLSFVLVVYLFTSLI